MNSQAVLAKVRLSEECVCVCVWGVCRGGGGINDFAENIKLRRKLQHFRRGQPWSGASEAIFAR